MARSLRSQGGKSRQDKIHYTRPQNQNASLGEGRNGDGFSSIDPKYAAAPISLIGLYNAIYGPQGELFPNHLLPLAAGLMDTRIEKLMMICGPGSGKALRNSTAVLTSDGWKAIDKIKLGDMVVCPDGKSLANVIGVFPQDPTNLYKITFADGRTVYAHPDHLWGVYFGNKPELEVEKTEIILNKLNKGIKVKIPLCEEINYGTKDFIDEDRIIPYLWGVCTACGDAAAGQGVFIRSNDKDFLQELVQYNSPRISISRIPEGAYFVFNNLEDFPRLIDYGIFSYNSTWRKLFIAGFLDATLTQTMSEGVKAFFPLLPPLKAIQRILWSLGIFASISEIPIADDCSGEFVLTIKPDFNPFINRRKSSNFRHKYKSPTTVGKLAILSIEKQLYIEPSTCICIDKSDGLFITKDYLVTHNSRLLLGIYPTWLIGVDPNSSFICVSASEGLPMTFMRSCMQIIESSPHFRRAFPDVRPDKEIGWSTKTGLYVTGRALGDAKANYFCAGVDSSVLTGLHANHLIFDDLHDKDNAYNAEQRKKLLDTYYNTLLHRSVAKGTRYIMAGRRWAEDDILGSLEDSGDWVTLTLPAERSGQTNLYYDITVPQGKECIFTDPGQTTEIEPTLLQKEKKLRAFRAYYGTDPTGEGFYWPELDRKRDEWHVIKRNSPDIAESIYQCRPGQRTGSVFMPNYFSYFSLDVPELSLQILPDFLKGQKIVQSWDTSHGRLAVNAFSACLTGILIPCDRWHCGENEELIGPAEPHLDIYVVDAFKAKLAIDELLHEIRRKHLFWQASEVCIEEKASGIPALQILPTAGCPVIPIKAWAGKRSRAVESIDGGTSSVQGWFKLGRVHFWAEASWLYDLELELKNFTGDNTGYKDQVDALVYLVSRAIKLSAGRITISNNSPMPASESIAKNELMNNSPDAMVWQQFEAINTALSMPSEESQFCFTCDNLKDGNYCPLQHRKVSNLDSCIDWKSSKIMARSGGIILPNNISMFGGFNFP